MQRFFAATFLGDANVWTIFDSLKLNQTWAKNPSLIFDLQVQDFSITAAVEKKKEAEEAAAKKEKEWRGDEEEEEDEETMRCQKRRIFPPGWKESPFVLRTSTLLTTASRETEEEKDTNTFIYS